MMVLHRPPAVTRLSPLLIGLGLVLKCQTGSAVDLSEYLFLPTVIQGERELDWHSGIGPSGPTTRQGADSGIGFGMGVTQHWYTELDLQFRHRRQSHTGLDSIEWENILQLAEPNQWSVDVSMLADLERPQDAYEGASLLLGPLFQKEFAKFQANFNVLIWQHFRTTEYPGTEVRYQSQFKYRYRRAFEYGLQAFGTLGSQHHSSTEYSEGLHRIGPVVLGRLPLRRERTISYNAAFLVGVAPHAFDRSLRVQIEYDF